MEMKYGPCPECGGQIDSTEQMGEPGEAHEVDLGPVIGYFTDPDVFTGWRLVPCGHVMHMMRFEEGLAVFYKEVTDV